MKHYLILIMMLPLILGANTYTLDELIEVGMQNSFQIQKSELSAKSASSALKSAKWDLAPDVDFSGKVNKDLDQISSSNSLSSGVGLKVSKTISLNDPSYFNYRFASLDKQTSDLSLRQSYSTYAYNVFQAYMEALAASKQKTALEENLAIQTRVWEQSKILLQLGKTTPYEVKQNEIAVMNSQISIIQLENTIATSRSSLFALTQMEDSGYPLQEIDIEVQKQIPAFSSDQALDLLILEQDIKRLEINQKRNKLSNYPSLSLGYDFSRSVGGNDFDFDTYTTNHQIGLNLSYSLWNHFKNGESSTRTKISKQIAKLSYEDKLDQMKRSYATIAKELEYLIRLNDLYQEKLSQSSEQIKIAEERYRLGMIQLLELDKTRTDYIDADIAYHSNRYQIVKKQEAIHQLLSQKIQGKW